MEALKRKLTGMKRINRDKIKNPPHPLYSRKFLSFISLWFIFLTFQTSAQTYTNPVIPGDFPDPSVIRVGEDFYATATTGGWSPHFPILHSKDLVNWQIVGAVFDGGETVVELGGFPGVAAGIEDVGDCAAFVRGDFAFGYGFQDGVLGFSDIDWCVGLGGEVEGDGLVLRGWDQTIEAEFQGEGFAREGFVDGFAGEGAGVFFEDGAEELGGLVEGAARTAGTAWVAWAESAFGRSTVFTVFNR